MLGSVLVATIYLLITHVTFGWILWLFCLLLLFCSCKREWEKFNSLYFSLSFNLKLIVVYVFVFIIHKKLIIVFCLVKAIIPICATWHTYMWMQLRCRYNNFVIKIFIVIQEKLGLGLNNLRCKQESKLFLIVLQDYNMQWYVNFY